MTETNTSTFREVKPDAPCEICTKSDWCRRSDDGCHECHRTRSPVPGYRLLKTTESGYGLFRQDDPLRAPPGRTRDAGRKQRTFQTVEDFIRTLGDRHGGTWYYRRPDGGLALVVVRINEANGKRFLPLHPISGGWTFGDPPGPLPLYDVPAIATADPVFILEGEKCAEAAKSIGLLATTSAHGAASPGKSDWAPLAGKRCFVMPDCDKAGAAYALSVARILGALHPPAQVKIVRLPGLPEGGDIVDWLAERECADPADLRREIEELAAAAPWHKAIDSAPPTDSLPAYPGPSWLTIAEVEALPSYRRGLQPITTGYAALDDALRGGFRPECMYTLAARTGSAKTTLALNIARRVALSGHGVLVFKLEESPAETVWRLHAAASQVDFRLLLDGAARATAAEQTKLHDGWGLIRSLPIRLSACRDLAGIGRIARAHVEQDGKFIIVDQLSMIHVEGADVGYIQATTASNALRLLAVELHVPMLLVAQVNRPAARKDNEHLSCHDLRDSGAIENDSAAVLLIDRVRSPGIERSHADALTLELILGKNRYGRITDPDRPIELAWHPWCCRVEDKVQPAGEGLP